MSQFLHRGFEVSNGRKIKRAISDEGEWQIYVTNADSFVLAVSKDLYRKWVSECYLPEGIFTESNEQGCYIFSSSADYLISSLNNGPFPDTLEQIDAFSLSYNNAVKLLKDKSLNNAVYIEEYSIILPTDFSESKSNNKIVYGRWITGGINISIDSISQISSFMTWLRPEDIAHSAQLAGFKDLSIDNADVKSDTDTKENINKSLRDSEIKSERFTLLGRPELEKFFNENIIDIVLHSEEYKRMGIDFPGATILYGPPGCGKTYAVERLSEYLGWPRFDIDSSTIASSFIHDTSKKISEVFNSAIESSPSIIVIDEMEAFLMDRGLSGPGGAHHIEEVAEFLRRIPEAISKGVLVFAMTNMIDSIDPAILRRGRFDHIVEVNMASTEEIEALLDARFEELPIDENVSAHDIAEKLSGHPMSDISFVVREAGRAAVQRKLEKIDIECFKTSLSALPKKKEKNKVGF